MEHRLVFRANGFEPLEVAVITRAERPTCKTTTIQIEDRFFRAEKKGLGWQVERKGKLKNTILYSRDKVELAALLIKHKVYPPGTHVIHKTFRLVKRTEKTIPNETKQSKKRRKPARGYNRA
jgi:hypothetical protein